MGKISDALDKFQTENGNTPVFEEKPLNVIDTKKKEPSEDQGKTPEKPTPFVQPTRNQNFDRTLVSLLKPQSFEAEQFRMLKSKLLFPATGEAPRSILVTSASPGEGKSFVSANTAVSIAQNINEHVLLMDCDVRRPSIHKVFGFEKIPPGLSDYLAKDVSLSSLLLKTNINKLTILSGGNTPSNPSELISSAKMSKLMDELTQRYSDRYIIIDSPPPKLTSETNVLAKLVDKILIVVDYSKTKKEMVEDLIESLGKEKIIGIFLNKCDASEVSYGYTKYGKNQSYYNQ